jgi:hypothetical protein
LHFSISLFYVLVSSSRHIARICSYQWLCELTRQATTFFMVVCFNCLLPGFGLLVYIEVQCLIYYGYCIFYQLRKMKIKYIGRKNCVKKFMSLWKLVNEFIACMFLASIRHWYWLDLIEWSVSIYDIARSTTECFWMLLHWLMLQWKSQFIAWQKLFFSLFSLFSLPCEIIWHNFDVRFQLPSNWQFC